MYEWEWHVGWEASSHHPDPHHHAGAGVSLGPEQGDQLYLLVRYGQARTVVGFATSPGFSTIFLAAALKDSGRGMVHTAEIAPEKVQQAREPQGDDFALIEGWAPAASPDVLRVIEPKSLTGALVYNENGDREFLDYVREHGSGYLGLPLLSGSAYKPQGELSLRARGSGESGCAPGPWRSGPPGRAWSGGRFGAGPTL
ncbi:MULTISPECIES: O-methyltransferase [unclassified Streptomyces]|uniref:O-methyltransferase n=1 Tax=unclassified Streptomyces TaxID=2593676 RepID=UPI0003802ADB|nr:MULTISPECIES: hypothetical protein [unclassified Streptomyces]